MALAGDDLDRLPALSYRGIPPAREHTNSKALAGKEAHDLAADAPGSPGNEDHDPTACLTAASMPIPDSSTGSR